MEFGSEPPPTVKSFYEALGGGKGPGAYRSKVSSGTSKVSSETLKDFYEAIGMKKARCKVPLPRANCKVAA